MMAKKWYQAEQFYYKKYWKYDRRRPCGKMVLKLIFTMQYKAHQRDCNQEATLFKASLCRILHIRDWYLIALKMCVKIIRLKAILDDVNRFFFDVIQLYVISLHSHLLLYESSVSDCSSRFIFCYWEVVRERSQKGRKNFRNTDQICWQLLLLNTYSMLYSCQSLLRSSGNIQWLIFALMFIRCIIIVFQFYIHFVLLLLEKIFAFFKDQSITIKIILLV